MIELIKYQLIVTICIIVFYGFYKLFLKNETFFNFNRFLILFLISISFAIPLVKIGTSLPIVSQKPEIITIGQSAEIVSQPIIETTTSTSIKEVNQATPVNWNLIALYAIGVINLAGILWGLIRLTKSLLFFRYLRRKSETATYNDTKFYIVPETIGSFSFFNSIFISKETINKGEVGSILAHELTHINEHHSLDSIFLALVKSFLWFNPVIYLFEKELKTVHEYIADSSVIKIEKDKNNYIDILLNQTIGPKMFDLTNNFNSTTIFRRIKMITKTKSTKRTLWKYLLLLIPLTFTMYAFSFSEQKLTKAIENREIKNAVEDYLTFSMVVPNITSDDITTGDTIKIANFTDKDYKFNNCNIIINECFENIAEPLPSKKEYLNLLLSLKKTPEEIIRRNITCQVTIEFDVNIDGTLSNFQFLVNRICGNMPSKTPIGFGTTEEALRVMKELSKTVKWKPQTLNGKPVISKGAQHFFFGDKELWEMYNVSEGSMSQANGADIYIVNPCRRDFFKEPSWFTDEHFSQLMATVGSDKNVFIDKKYGIVKISFGITPEGTVENPVVDKAADKEFTDIVLKAVTSLKGLKVDGFNHIGKRYIIKISYGMTGKDYIKSYKITTEPAPTEKK